MTTPTTPSPAKAGSIADDATFSNLAYVFRVAPNMNQVNEAFAKLSACIDAHIERQVQAQAVCNNGAYDIAVQIGNDWRVRALAAEAKLAQAKPPGELPLKPAPWITNYTSRDPEDHRLYAGKQMDEYGEQCYRAGLAAQAAGGAVPSVCDGKEQDEFIAWAIGEKMDMECHPLHFLFLNGKTNAARQAWKAALQYVSRTIAAPLPPAKAQGPGETA